jgi:phospholipid-transporting ATPase
LNVDNYISVSGELHCENPNKNLESFKGNIIVSGKDHTLSEKQLLLKGASLQNTDWVIGLVVYTGEETKIMLNS